MTDPRLLTDEELDRARMLTGEEMWACVDQVNKYADANPGVAEVFKLKLRELTGRLSAQKVVLAQLAKVDRLNAGIKDEEICELLCFRCTANNSTYCTLGNNINQLGSCDQVKAIFVKLSPIFRARAEKEPARTGKEVKS